MRGITCQSVCTEYVCVCARVCVCVCVCVQGALLCVVTLADLAGKCGLFSSFDQMTKLSMPVVRSQYCLLYYVSTLVQFFGDLNHVIVCGQRAESDCFVILAAHVIGTKHQRAALSPTLPPVLCRPTQRESVTKERKVSVLCRHIFNSQDES